MAVMSCCETLKKQQKINEEIIGIDDALTTIQNDRQCTRSADVYNTIVPNPKLWCGSFRVVERIYLPAIIYYNIHKCRSSGKQKPHPRRVRAINNGAEYRKRHRVGGGVI